MSFDAHVYASHAYDGWSQPTTVSSMDYEPTVANALTYFDALVQYEMDNDDIHQIHVRDENGMLVELVVPYDDEERLAARALFEPMAQRRVEELMVVED